MSRCPHFVYIAGPPPGYQPPDGGSIAVECGVCGRWDSHTPECEIGLALIADPSMAEFLRSAGAEIARILGGEPDA